MSESGTQSSEQEFILEIEWNRPASTSPVLPNRVGPFATRQEAQSWASLNVPNGSWIAGPLAHPHGRTWPKATT